MADKRLQKLFREAAELVKDVPETLRDTAYNRALDMLLEEHAANPDGDGNALWRFGMAGRDLVMETVVEALNFTSRRLGKEEVTAEELTEILTERFGLRLPITLVAKILASADGIVRMVHVGGKTVYRVVRPANGPASDEARTRPKAKTATARERSRHAETPPPEGESLSQILADLAALGFFQTARTVTDLVIYLEKKGFDFSTQQLTPALLRLLQAGLLRRKKNPRGVYEYKET